MLSIIYLLHQTTTEEHILHAYEIVVYYLSSTSNHNQLCNIEHIVLLSIIYLLHQTTTPAILYRYFHEVTSFLRLTKWTPNYLRSVFDAIF